ncbi:MAG TPA: hypothetical protein VGR46_10580 [Candidatus Limnocylindria bacterium]|jgi:hypothetical protein|nr:hypothetical protein [Candidatus Limnocylindria bacterium]
MNPTQATYLRLLLICAAFAAGETAAWALGAYSVGLIVGAILGAAAYVLTQDIDRSGRGGRRRGEIRYWRGRRIDEDDGPRRWN